MRYLVTIEVESQLAPEIVLKDVRDGLEQQYKYTHEEWLKNYSIAVHRIGAEKVGS